MSPPRRVFVTGATGLIGRRLCAALVAEGDQVVALSRNGRPDQSESRAGLRWIQGDLNAEDSALAELSGCDAVVHLAGEPIAGARWTSARKRRLVASRVATTRRIVAALAVSEARPSVLLCASACGFYGPRGDAPLDESSSSGTDFLAQLCVDWEGAAAQASQLGVRVVSLRFAAVLSRSGGALAPMARAFRWGAGGPLGPPGRWFPWIHEDDALALIRLALDRELAGPLNLVSPEAVTMGEFATQLGRTLRRPCWLPLPAPLLRVALGEMSEALFPGQRIIPKVAVEAGFEFAHAALEDALSACLG